MEYRKIFSIIIILLLILLLIDKLDPVFKNEDVVVFVIDSKISPDVINNKPIFYGNKVTHGSIVTLLIKKEVPGVDIIPLDVNDRGRISEGLYYSSLRRVIDYKIKNPEKKIIVNISLAFSKYQELHHSLIKKLNRLGVLIITAAGNNNSTTLPYPARFEETITVASAGVDGKEQHSNYGRTVDIAAPGVLDKIFRIYYAGGLKYSHLKSTGTSLSTPRVSGLTAKVLTLDNSLTSVEAFNFVMNYTDSINDQLYKDGLLGAGVINKKKVLSKLNPLYFLQETSFLIIFIFVVVLIFLWFKHGIVSIFLTLLIILAVIPILLLIEEFIFYITEEGLEALTLTITGILSFLLLLPFFLKRKVRHQLVDYLENTGKPDVDYLLTFINKNENLLKIIKEHYKVKTDKLANLIDSLKEGEPEKKGLIKEIFSVDDTGEYVPELFQLLKGDSGQIDENTEILILEIMEEMGKRGVILDEEIKEYTKGILFSVTGDMWLRYQALRTFYYGHSVKDNSVPYLKRLLKDGDELIRLEAEGLLKEYIKGDENYV